MEAREYTDKVILVGEDEAEVRSYLDMALRCLGYSVELARDGDEVVSYLESGPSKISAVLLDLLMPQRDGFETLKAIRSIDAKLPVIMLSGASSVRNVVTAMRFGATDFLCKPFEHEDLKKTITSALDQKPYTQSPAESSGSTGAGENWMALGDSPAMKAIWSQVANIGWSDEPVLIQGETGTGKEVLARKLHANSSRADKVFLKLNCAALPAELLESELFGYERGAFTGAHQRKAGMFEVANGGTLMLDEIGDMDIRLQAKLLHVLQDHQFHRIGGKEVIRVDVRIMAATHQNLEKAIGDKTFREDLYYRLNVINLRLPPLRERKEDILQLAETLLRKHLPPGKPIPTITPNLKRALMAYRWPGNIRELENAMRNLNVFRDPESLASHLLGKTTTLTATKTDNTTASPVRSSPASEIERKIILAEVTDAQKRAEAEAILGALDSTRWNRKQAAALLEVDYKVFLYKMKKFNIPGKIAVHSGAGTETAGNSVASGGCQ